LLTHLKRFDTISHCMIETTKNTNDLDELFKAGAHFGFSKSRRHPSTENFLFGSKNRVDIFDLEKTKESLDKALDFIKKLSTENAKILFVGGKPEAQEATKKTAEELDQPYVASRWIGGTLTNFSEISKRVEIMKNLMSQKERGELAKYTKKERVLIDRDIEKLQKMFWGIRDLGNLPKALVIIDPRYEDTALKEAKGLKIPTVALCGSDNDISLIDYPITGNDSSITSIRFFVEKIGEAYKEGKKQTKQ